MKAFTITKIVVGNEKTGHKIVTIPKDCDIEFGDIVKISLHKRKNETKKEKNIISQNIDQMKPTDTKKTYQQKSQEAQQ